MPRETACWFKYWKCSLERSRGGTNIQDVFISKGYNLIIGHEQQHECLKFKDFADSNYKEIAPNSSYDCVPKQNAALSGENSLVTDNKQKKRMKTTYSNDSFKNDDYECSIISRSYFMLRLKH